jgi:hypothetical protein
VTIGSEALLVGVVVAVGILHTLVPDHWLPIALVARSAGWTRMQTARAGAAAGLGHTLSTLALGIVVWLAGLALAQRFGNLLSLLSSIALIAFGLWIAISSLLDIKRGAEHRNERAHERAAGGAQQGKRTTLLLILGSSPMAEGIPAFFAASRFGIGLLLVMAVCFAVSTIATYALLCANAQAALERVSMGPLERYAEVLSGAIVALVGIIFLIWPLA